MKNIILGSIISAFIILPVIGIAYTQSYISLGDTFTDTKGQLQPVYLDISNKASTDSETQLQRIIDPKTGVICYIAVHTKYLTNSSGSRITTNQAPEIEMSCVK